MLEITEVCILLFVNALLLLNGLAGLLMTSVGLDSRAHTVWDEPLFPAGSGSATYEALRNYQESMSWHGKLTSGVLSIQLCCSIALIVLSILALYGILKLKHRPLYIASYTLAVIIILTFGEAIIWIVGIFSKVVPTQNELTDTRASAGSFTGYYSNATLRTQRGVAAVDGFQAGHACCGWEGFRDWQTVLPSGDVPSSCCNQVRYPSPVIRFATSSTPFPPSRFQVELAAHWSSDLPLLHLFCFEEDKHPIENQGSPKLSSDLINALCTNLRISQISYVLSLCEASEKLHSDFGLVHS